MDISATEEIKKQEKGGMSTGAKWALGIATTAAAVYGCVVGHRMLNKPSIEKVAKNFSEIFRRDVSKEEAKVLTEKYKDIFKVEDCDEFCKKIFEQVKKDFGYEKVGIKLEVEKMADTSVASAMSKHEIASYNHLDGILKLNPTHFKNGKMSGADKFEMLKSLMHEFQHAKQSEFAYRTDPRKYMDACQVRLQHKNSDSFVTDMIKNLEEMLKSRYDLSKYMKENNFKSIDEAKKKIEDLILTLKKDEQRINNAFSNAKIDEKYHFEVWDKLFGNMPKFRKGSKEYELGLKYIDGQANYVNGSSNYDAYKQQLVEKEAFGTEPLVNKIYNFFANPWRVF